VKCRAVHHSRTQEFETRCSRPEEQTEARGIPALSGVLNKVAARIPRIQRIAHAPGEVDRPAALAEVAER